MKILIVGAGALGGYFGARLLAAHRDVTFLLRPGRAAQLAKSGLVVKSRFGDLALPPPPHLLAGNLVTHFDVVIVGCKAYDLAQTMESFAPAVGPGTAILPLLKGMRHLDQLLARFGERHVLGAQCMISAVLDKDGAVLHLNDIHKLAFGERDGSDSARVAALTAAFADANFDSAPGNDIVQQMWEKMWEKWVFIAAGAGMTTLMRGAIGDIIAGGGAALNTAMLAECEAIAAHNGHAPRAPASERARAFLTAPGSMMTASMLKDMERGAATEADHIIGDLIGRGDGKREALPLLTLAYTHLQTYAARRARETPAP